MLENKGFGLRISNFLFVFFQLTVKVFILFPHLGNFLTGVNHSSMIPAELAADTGQGNIGQLAAEIHGNLSGFRDILGPFMT